MPKYKDSATRLPAQDLVRARKFYSEKLGLDPVEEREGGLRYEIGNSCFALFETTGEPSGTHTQIGIEVEDIEATVEELKAKGVEFEEYGIPGLPMENSMVVVPGNYPSEGGVGEKAAWFKDSEGNLLGIGETLT